jgi:hypothetical protein
MRNPDAALAGWASRTRSWPQAPSLGRDLALPLVLLSVQLIGAAIAGRSFHLFGPARPLEPVDWLLLVVGPVALVARRRHPVLVLWVTFAGMLAPSGTGLAHFSFVVAFFVAATAGKRHEAWLALAAGYVWDVWLAPLAYGYAISLTDMLLLAGWLLALAIAAEAARVRGFRVNARLPVRPSP